MEKWEIELRHKKHFDHLIINRPEALTKLRRHAEVSVTTIGWVIWFFVCRPLFMVLLWMAGVGLFLEHMINLDGLRTVLMSWPLYAGIILFLIVVIRGWNVYNKSKYGKRNRRKNSDAVTEKELEVFFHMPEASASSIQSSQAMDVDFQEDHKLSISTEEKQSNIPLYFKPQ